LQFSVITHKSLGNPSSLPPLLSLSLFLLILYCRRIFLLSLPLSLSKSGAELVLDVRAAAAGWRRADARLQEPGARAGIAGGSAAQLAVAQAGASGAARVKRAGERAEDGAALRTDAERGGPRTARAQRAGAGEPRRGARRRGGRRRGGWRAGALQAARRWPRRARGRGSDGCGGRRACGRGGTGARVNPGAAPGAAWPAHG
jgi:hypothetical protein